MTNWCKLADMGGASRHVVVLVHGTWTNARKFRKRAERLCEVLKRECSATVLHHCWTGENRHSARERGSKRLLRRLERVRRANPSAVVSIVAHSHGGNVVLSALTNPGAEALVDRVVFVATPFLSARPRGMFPGEKEEGSHSLFFVLAFAAAVVYLLGEAADLALESLETSFHVVTAAAARRWFKQHSTFGLVLAYFPVLVAVFRVFRELDERCHRKARVLLASRTLDESWRSRVLIVRPAADEVGMVLVAAQFLSFVSNRVGALVGSVLYLAGRLAIRPAELLDTATKWGKIVFRLYLILIGCLTAAAFLARGTVQHLGIVVVGFVFEFARKAMMAVFALGLLISVISILRSVPATILLASFGWDLFGLGWQLEVTSESTPPGLWTTCLAQPPAPTAPRVLGLSHKEIYSQPDVIDKIVHWLSSAESV